MNKNLVFIMTDHQRYDSINMVQDGKEVTPNLNNLCKEGALFERTYNTCPLCVPARTALATGKNPIDNGVVFNDVKGLRAGDYKTIHEKLFDDGYEVAHVGVHHIRVKPDLRDRECFSLFIEDDDYDAYAKSKGIVMKRSEDEAKEVLEFQEGTINKHKYSNTKVTLWSHGLENFKDYYFTEKALEFIKGDHEKPFALFLYFWAPHPPLRVPEEYINKFNPDNIDLPGNVGEVNINEPSSRRKGVAAQLGEGLNIEEWRKVWSAHLGLVNFADAMIGKVVNGLKEKGIYDDTTIVFTSDHGDHLGQHNMYQKMEMYDQAIRVPLIIKDKAIEHNKYDFLVSHLDIVPTVLDLLNVKNLEQYEGQTVRSLIKNDDLARDRAVFSYYSGNPTIGDIRRAVVWKNYKYVYDGTDEEELFDLDKDALEVDNLACDDNFKDVLKVLRDKCKNNSKKYGDWV